MQTANGLASMTFYVRYGWFQLRERFTDLASSVAYLLLYPFFIWLLAQMWGRFNAYQGNYSLSEVYVYLSITELLFMTFLRSPFMNRANADFSITLARPRSWLRLALAGQIGATLGGRLVYSSAALVVLHLLDISSSLIFTSFLRLLMFLPILGVIEALMASLLQCAQLIWHETRYLTLPISKIFLALGGVFGPLADYGEPGRSIFLELPASDMFFQVGHFCLRGEFYQMTILEWCLRMALWTLIFLFLAVICSRYARKHHQSFGG
jgi:hypothetical protein